MYSGISTLHIIAVFSDSTKATLLYGYRSSRCSPNRHWVNSHSCGSCPLLFIIECTQFILPPILSSFILCPVSLLYFIILPVLHLFCLSIWKNITSLLFVTPNPYSITRSFAFSSPNSEDKKIVKSLWYSGLIDFLTIDAGSRQSFFVVLLMFGFAYPIFTVLKKLWSILSQFGLKPGLSAKNCLGV